MYNLIIGFKEGAADGGRMLEHTNDVVKAYVAPDRVLDHSRLVNLPTLVMPELGDSNSPQIARIGHIEDLVRTGRDYTYRFVPNADIGDIPTGRIAAAAQELDISDWEFRRTHWAVKDVDLHRVVTESITGIRLKPRVFRLPTELPQNQSLIAVMMPFDGAFDPVYEAIREAVLDVGLICQRADDIWVSNHVMEDVIGLLWSAQVVIADLTFTNANVLYETGIAHALGRETIQIAQNPDDIPFDLRGLRSVHYDTTASGLDALQGKLKERLRQLVVATGR